MIIDWIGVGAQIINFLILVFLLSKFLFRPLLRAIDERDALLQKKEDDLVHAQQVVEKERELIEQEKNEFRQKKESLLQQAYHESLESKEKMIEETKKAVSELKDHLLDRCAKELAEHQSEIQEKIQREIFLSAQKVLRDLASIDVEKCVFNQFLFRLQSLPEQEKKRIVEAFRDKGEPITIMTTFPLPAEDQKRVSSLLVDIIGKTIPCYFESTLDGICGCLLRSKGYTMGWRMEEYLEALNDTD